MQWHWKITLTTNVTFSVHNNIQATGRKREGGKRSINASFLLSEINLKSQPLLTNISSLRNSRGKFPAHRKQTVLHLDPPLRFSGRWNNEKNCVQLQVGLSFKILVVEVFAHYKAFILMRIFNVQRPACRLHCRMSCFRELLCSLPHKISLVVTKVHFNED